MDKKTKEVVDLSPKNSEYAAKIQQARSMQHPVGGAPMPENMPNFAAAQQQGDRYTGVQNTQHRARGMATLLTPEQRQHLEASGQARSGVGSAFVVNQPAAQQIMQPQQAGYQNPPRPEGAGLSAQTAAELEAVARANAPEEEKKAAEAKQQEKEIEELDDVFDFDELGNKVKDILANKERRELIESRCEPLDMMDLLVNREIRQVVPIIPNKYFPTFRTMSGEEDLEVKRLLSVDQGSSTYLLARYSLMNLTCGLYSINGQPLQDHRGKDGAFDKEAFLAKYKSVLRYPIQILADLSANYVWFDKRVKALLSFDAIKNF